MSGGSASFTTAALRACHGSHASLPPLLLLPLLLLLLPL